jgi:hypothetical protein
MRSTLCLAAALCLGLAGAASAAGTAEAADNSLTEKGKKQGWKLLFDGQSLNGWRVTGKSEGWGVEDGAIACKVLDGGYLYTADQYADFVFSADYKVAPGTNSGIFFRWSNLSDPVNTGMEMQILDSHGKAPGKHEDGAIYDLVAPAKNASKPAGEWNHAVIRCKDNLVTIRVNGEKVSEMDLNRWTEIGKNPDGSANKFKFAFKQLPRHGYIGFQDHGGKVWYKNVRIRKLTAATE